MKNVKLVLVGPDDGYKTHLEKRAKKIGIQDKLLFTGYVSEKEKIEAFVDSDVLITPRFYGFPIVFAEALACGLPIVATNKGDVLEWIHNQVGYITEYDSNQLKDAILRILEDKQTRDKFSENCKRLVNEKFNWEIITNKIEKIYFEIIL